MLSDKNKQNKFYIFYLQYFKLYSIRLMGLFLIIIIGVVSSNVAPIIYGKMIDAITTESFITLKNYIIIYFCITIFSLFVGIIENYIGQIISFKISSEIKERIFKKIIYMKVQSLDSYSVGELVSRLDSDASGVVSYYIDVATSIALILFNLIMSVYLVFSISSQLSVVSTFFIPVSAIITLLFRAKYKELSKKEKEYSDRYYTFTTETFSNVKGIKAYLIENKMQERFKNFLLENLKIIKRSLFLSNTMSTLNNLVSLTFTLVIIYFSGKIISEGKMSVGSMIAFGTYVNKLFDATSRILNFNLDAQSIGIAIDRINNLLKEPDEVEIKPENRFYEKNLNSIIIKNIDFKYKEEYVLKNFSLSITKPGFYAIVGKNGCGKSTLAKLLLRFYDICKGDILLNELPINKYSIKFLRDQITFVQKETFIFNSSIKENIMLANPSVSFEDIVRVCDIVGLSDLVSKLPAGYDTKLGENGSFLSSGQKQKINIARALIRNSPIILFDEITSDLDGVSEKEVIKIIQDIAKTSIVFFISHKISSIEQSDEVILMDEGKLVIKSTHQLLIIDNVLYQNLFKYDYEDNKEVTKRIE